MRPLLSAAPAALLVLFPAAVAALSVISPPAAAEASRVQRPASLTQRAVQAPASLPARTANGPAPALTGAARMARPHSAPRAVGRRPLARRDTAELRRSLERITSEFGGIAGISVRNLTTSESISIRGDEKYPSASLIKVPILVALLEEVEQGRMRLDERVSLIARDRVGGSGVMKHLHSGANPTLEDLAWLMITLSDNTATNMLLDKLDIATVGEKMEELGLPESKVHSKTFRRETSIAPDSSALYGFGVATPDEMVELFTMLHEGRAVSPAMDSVAMRMLFANQDGNMMVRWLPGRTRVAHKTGSVNETRNDCGIMYTPAAPIALCVMTRENEDTSYAVDSAPHLLIARIAREVFRHWNPTEALPALPVVEVQ